MPPLSLGVAYTRSSRFKTKKQTKPASGPGKEAYLRALFCLHGCLIDLFCGVVWFSGHVARGSVLCQVAALCSQAGNNLVPPHPEWGMLTHPCVPSSTLYFRQTFGEALEKLG